MYRYEPIPAELTADEEKHVLGSQGQLWTEYMPNPKRVEYMAWPRLAALAEVLWSPKEARDWDGFQQYWQHMVDHVLEDTRPVREGFRMHRTAPPPRPEQLPEWINAIVGPYVLKPLLQAPAMRFANWLTVASLPEPARDRLCLEWTRRDEFVYRTYLKAAHAAVLALPEDKGFHPIALQARTYQSEHGSVQPIPLPLRPAHPKEVS